MRQAWQALWTLRKRHAVPFARRMLAAGALALAAGVLLMTVSGVLTGRESDAGWWRASFLFNMLMSVCIAAGMLAACRAVECALPERWLERLSAPRDWRAMAALNGLLALGVTIGAFAAMLLCGPARADGLADLKAALSRLQAQTPLKATLEAKTWRRSGEGRDADEYSGSASVALEDGSQGMRLQYGRELLTRMDGEQQAMAKNPNAKTPTLYAMRELGPDDLRPMVSAAEGLARQLERTTFKGEKAATHNGKPARQLSFSVPVTALSDRERKYLKEFDGRFDVWIDAAGTPLASHLNLQASGRAFVVVGFDYKQDEQCPYALAGDRLLVTRKESKTSNAGAGEKSEDRVVKTLQAG